LKTNKIQNEIKFHGKEKWRKLPSRNYIIKGSGGGFAEDTTRGDVSNEITDRKYKSCRFDVKGGPPKNKYLTC